MDRRSFLTAGAVMGAAITTVAAAPAAAAEVTVSSLAALQDAVNQAVPGSVIKVASGTYNVPDNGHITLSGTAGSSAAAITILAATRGQVTFTGNCPFVFSSASFITISGFVFRHDNSMDLGADSHNLRITRNVFQLGDAAGHSLVVRGNDVKVDRNAFHSKSTAGCYLVVDGPGGTEQQQVSMAQRTHIFKNHFRDHSFAASNGGEALRLGVSSRALGAADAKAEYNLFERVNGDPEAISVKSSGSIIRYNTIRSSLGGIVLRQGNANRVEANYILGGSNGIRIYGNDHLIVNNYVAGISGAGITLGSGTVRDHYSGESSTSRKGQDAPDRVRVALNTLRNNAQAVVGESQRTLPPLACTVADNIFTGDGEALVEMPYNEGITWKGNLTWGAAATGNIPSGGFLRADPKLTVGTDGVYRLGSGSAAINAAALDHSGLVSTDLDGEARTAPFDTGADERSTATVLPRRPLLPADVGPDAP